MPITRRQLTGVAASTSNPLLPTQSLLPFSEDDCFEQSAIQVSSASRPTRTINHKLPKDIGKDLFKQNAALKYAAASLESKENSNSSINHNHNHSAQSNTNIENNQNHQNTHQDNLLNRSKAAPSRPFVKRSLPATKNNSNSSVSSSANSSAKKLPSTSAAPTKIQLSAPKRIDSDNDDSIFDVPISPSPPRTTENNIISIANSIPAISTPIKRPLVAKPTGLPLTPSKLNLQPAINTTKLLAEIRKTPLTMAEKKRRGSMTLDKTTKTDIALLQSKKEPVRVVTEPVIVAESSEEQAEVIEPVENVQFIDVTVSDEEKTPIKAYRVDNEDTFSIEIENASEQNIQKMMTKHFIRDQATESAPPDIISGPSKTVKSVAFEAHDGLSLVIEVPPPPKLEDLETLDPELYVKIKSGNLKDDLTIPFISEPDRQDIESFLETFTSPEFAKTLLPVAIIGEGTFSTVYKVIDKNFYECENGGWTDYSRQNPLDWLRLWRWVYNEIESNNGENKDKFVLYKDGKRCVDRHGRTVSGTKTSSSSSTSSGKLGILLRRYLLEWAVRSLESLLPAACEPTESILSSITPRALQSAMLRFRPFFIALKRINSTSSPQRILDEMSFLKLLGGKNNVVPVINGLRCEDQVLVTFPYFYSEEFREFLNSSTMTVSNIACYMRSLFISLAHLHHHGIIHRDVKPSNFLYAPESGGRAVLLDFGLAQKSNSTSSTVRGGARYSGHHASRVAHGNRNNEKERKKLQAVNVILNTLGAGAGAGGAAAGTSTGAGAGAGAGDDACDKLIQLTTQLGPGYFNNDPRAGMKASRAGTRGFRAPEVLLKCPNQTTALDIWSAGVILLTLLTKRYPFFQSSDDFDAIVEIANIFGNEEMSAASRLYNRKWHCNIPSVPEKHLTWPLLCSNLYPSFAKEIPDECFDLVAECLNLNSDKRISARNALKHPFILKYAK